MPKDGVLDRRCIDHYMHYLCSEKGMSPLTVIHYAHDVTMFMRFVAKQLGDQQQLRITDITPQHIQAFLDYLQEDRRNNRRSAKRRLAALRSFFDYAIGMSPTLRGSFGNPALVILTPTPPDSIPRPLTAEEATSLLRAVRAHGPNPRRDYAILRLFLHCGARLSEVLHLDLDDINLDEMYVRLDANGKRDRLVPLSEETARALQDYLRERPDVPSPRVFINRSRKPISKGAVYYALAKSVASPSLPPNSVTINRLRHNCFTLLAKAGLTVEELQAVAGLRDKKAPRLYVRLAREQSVDPISDHEAISLSTASEDTATYPQADAGA